VRQKRSRRGGYRSWEGGADACRHERDGGGAARMWRWVSVVGKGGLRATWLQLRGVEEVVGGLGGTLWMLEEEVEDLVWAGC